MGLFTKEKRERTSLESYIENTAFTIAREARNEAPEAIALVGRNEFRAAKMRQFEEIAAHLDYPLPDVEFRLLRSTDLPGDDVCMYVRVKGNASVFQHVGNKYRLKGALSTEGPHKIYLHYRSHQFGNAEQVKRLFDDDVEVLRQFLYDVERIMDQYRLELSRQLNVIVESINSKLLLANNLVTDLESLGFKPKE